MTGSASGMAVHRTDIERALDELISNEDGMRFQGLAVVLAKQKWPDLVASERHKDLGLDAYARAVLAPDKVGKGLACSITPTLRKIEEDATKVRQNFSDVTILIFATPAKVCNEVARGWSDKIRESFGYELVVMPREDIISSLMLPSNAPICRTQLGISVALGASDIRDVESVRAANCDVIAAWLAHPRLAGRPQLALQAARLDEEGKESGETLSLATIATFLKEGRRLVLEGPAGRGKTTTLIQLAQARVGDGGLGLLVDFSEWVRSRQDILEFIARMPQYRARGVDAATLARLYGVEHLSFLLNGWNEVSEANSEDAVQALAQLERDYPASGIIVATRTHYVSPPLPGSFRIRLLPLNRVQRTDYLRQALGDRADELRLRLEGNRVLDDLTRTPLILAEVTTLFQSGAPIPSTKVEVLGAVMQLIAQSEDHRDHLQRPPLWGRADDYLAEFAAHMIRHGDVRILEDQSRAICQGVSLRLKDAGQIATLPEPASVLNTLCAHHVLERLDYPYVAFRFEHQQFQEFYAASVLRSELWALTAGADEGHFNTFALQYVNWPMWEESLRMIAEEVKIRSAGPAVGADAIRAGKRLVEMTLALDPIFAAELSRLCGAAVWPEIRGELGARLRSWYATGDDCHRQCALAGMLASGTDEFSDIMLPLLTSDDQQVRLRTYRAWGDFHVSSLGPDWRRVVGRWAEDQRIDFIFEVLRNRWIGELGEDFALADPSPRVRVEAIRALSWFGADDALARYLGPLDDETFEAALHKLSVEDIPSAQRSRAIAAYRSRLSEAADGVAQLRLLLATAAWGDGSACEGIKDTLTRLPPGRVGDPAEPVVKAALDVVGAVEPGWASDWVTARIIDGSLWRDSWSGLVANVPAALQRELLDRIGSQPLQHPEVLRFIAVLTKVADAALAASAIERLYGVRKRISDAPDQRHETEWEISRQLEWLIRTFSSATAVTGLLNRFTGHIDLLEVTVAVDLYGRVGVEDDNLRGDLPEPLRQRFRAYLKRCVPFVLSQDDFPGHLKMHLAVALGRVGDPEDLADLERLIQADIDRLRKGRAALVRGEQNAIANGARMGCANWHVNALMRLTPEGAEAVLLRILREPEYEGEASKALVRLALKQPEPGWVGIRAPHYREVWAARAGKRATGFDEDRRRRYTAAINGRIDAVLEERRGSDRPDSLNGRVKGLAAILAKLNGSASSARVLEIMALPGEWDGWTRTETLDALLFSVAVLPADATLRVLNPTIEHTLKQGLYNDQNVGLLIRCLCLLPFVDEPTVGIERVGQVVSAANLRRHNLREIMVALGYSRCDAALPLLLQLAGADANGAQLITSEWVEAIAALTSAEARQLLLSFVDPEIGLLGINLRFGHHDGERLASCIADVARAEPAFGARVLALCNMFLPPTNRLLLSKIVTRLGTQEALLAGLNLIDDAANPRIPYDLVHGIENLLFDRRPYGSAYTLEPRNSNEIRAHLFSMVLNDGTRRKSAFALLGQIEVWRLDYGKPGTEPRHPAIGTGAPWPPVQAVGQA